mgnify:CR=1 FL=1|tara:strand:+ start:193 stop:1296 length:1104 start_codon:yes stop_codon:yes gene_type:complete
MAKHSSPSDFTAVNPNYATGLGYYTTAAKVAELLQVPDFTSTTTPMHSEVGEFIKRTEDFIDEKTGTSWRRLLYKDEHHNFTFGTGHYPATYWRDYVGFIQLDRHDIQKIIRLEVWQGNTWINLASAEAIVDMDDYTAMANGTTTIALRLPNSGLTFNLLAGTTTSRFDTTYGNKTAAQELVALINETFPAKTASLTGATAAKGQTDTTGAKNVSDFFYASIDSEDSSRVYITSLLPSDDGANCTISVSPSDDGITVSAFTDKEDSARMNEWWKIDREGRIFFRTKFPYVQLNSVKITYLAGSSRVPGVISDIATKLTACEILRSDDATVLITESGNQISVKEKYDLLRAEALDILAGKKEDVVLIE